MRLLALALVFYLICGSNLPGSAALASPQDSALPTPFAKPPLAKPSAPKRKLVRPQQEPAPATKEAAAEPPLPFSERWWAHENAVEDRLRKSITICRAC
jgi:hypothetical protein